MLIWEYEIVQYKTLISRIRLVLLSKSDPFRLNVKAGQFLLEDDLGSHGLLSILFVTGWFPSPTWVILPHQELTVWPACASQSTRRSRKSRRLGVWTMVSGSTRCTMLIWYFDHDEFVRMLQKLSSRLLPQVLSALMILLSFFFVSTWAKLQPSF